MNKLKEIDEHVLKCARVLYEDTALPMAEIAKLMGVSDRTLQARAALLHWRPRPNSRARRRLGMAPDTAPTDFAALARTVRAMVDKEIVEAERHLTKTGPRAPRMADLERSARVLASLTKTLNELKRLEAGGTDAAPKAENDDIDAEDYERDLARRLDALRTGEGT